MPGKKQPKKPWWRKKIRVVIVKSPQKQKKPKTEGVIFPKCHICGKTIWGGSYGAVDGKPVHDGKCLVKALNR